jgi:dephospho-CoA kinase
MLRIGITGGLGSGKSLAAHFFADRGARVFDADMEAKLILLRHEPIREAVIDEFGEVIMNEVGEIDFFTRLASHAFAKPKRQQRLNEIIHPEVILVAEREMMKASREGLDLFVLDVPLLFESHMERYLDYTIAVTAAEELRIQRALARGALSESDIRKRTKLQLTDEERVAQADFVVTNDGTVDELQRQLQEIFNTLTKAQLS